LDTPSYIKVHGKVQTLVTFDIGKIKQSFRLF